MHFFSTVLMINVHRTTRRHIVGTNAHKHTQQSRIIPASILVEALSEVMVDQSPDSFPLVRRRSSLPGDSTLCILILCNKNAHTATNILRI